MDAAITAIALSVVLANTVFVLHVMRGVVRDTTDTYTRASETLATSVAASVQTAVTEVAAAVGRTIVAPYPRDTLTPDPAVNEPSPAAHWTEDRSELSYDDDVDPTDRLVPTPLHLRPDVSLLAEDHASPFGIPGLKPDRARYSEQAFADQFADDSLAAARSRDRHPSKGW